MGGTELFDHSFEERNFRIVQYGTVRYHTLRTVLSWRADTPYEECTPSSSWAMIVAPIGTKQTFPSTASQNCRFKSSIS
jgi:hypothetical protein